MNHTCINIQMTADGSVPPPCAACALSSHATEQAYTRADVEAAWDRGYADGQREALNQATGGYEAKPRNPYAPPRGTPAPTDTKPAADPDRT